MIRPGRRRHRFTKSDWADLGVALAVIGVVGLLPEWIAFGNDFGAAAAWDRSLPGELVKVGQIVVGIAVLGWLHHLRHRNDTVPIEDVEHDPYYAPNDLDAAPEDRPKHRQS
jgi:hypothetical protein